MPLIDSSAAHRSTRSETLVWAIDRASDKTWWADVEIPRSHWLCHPVPTRVPVTLLAEAFRQAGLAVCVAGLDMGQSAQFVISKMNLDVNTDALDFPRFGALRARLEVTFTEIKYRKGLPHLLEVDYLLPGIATGHVTAQVLTSSEYRAIRRNAKRLSDDIQESAVDLIDIIEQDATRLRARLTVNEADPFFFDHPVDHLPGVLMLHVTTLIHERVHGVPPRVLAVAFPAFGELRSEALIEAQLSEHGLLATFTQGERTIAAGQTDTRNTDVRLTLPAVEPASAIPAG